MVEYADLDFTHIKQIESDDISLLKRPDFDQKSIKVKLLFLVAQAIYSVGGVVQRFGVGYSKLGGLFENEYIDATYYTDDHMKIGAKVITEIETNPNFFEGYIEAFRAHTEKLRAYTDSLVEHEFEKDELCDVLRNIFTLSHSAQSIGYITESFAISNKVTWIREYIVKHIPDVTDEEISVLLSPTKPSFMDNFATDSRKLNASELHRKYYWINSSYYKIKLQSEDDFLNPPHDESHFQKRDKIHILQRSDDESALRRFVETISEFIHVQDERKENVLRTNYILYRIVLAIEKYYGWEKEKVLHLTPHELLGLLNGDVKEEILEITTNPAVILFTAKSYSRITNENAFNEMKEYYKPAQVSELRGLAACRGIVRGVAKIILSEDDFDNFNENEILITSMTRPEFVPLMKKASAIVTNEGGVTCHAAILSRELNKPCVIGTKSATKVFKDGDIVEVDANTGVVRKVE